MTQYTIPGLVICYHFLPFFFRCLLELELELPFLEGEPPLAAAKLSNMPDWTAFCNHSMNSSSVMVSSMFGIPPPPPPPL
ncbi:hypothetical protein Hanom_Chr08g00729571 [Helianthus anomalus]